MRSQARVISWMRKNASGGFDHGDELGVADRHAALFFEFGHQFVEQTHVRGAVDLGDGDAVDVGTDRLFEVAHRHRQRAVDAHHHIRAAAPHLRRGFLDQGARLVLFAERHAVFEIELDHVGAARVRLVDEFVDVDRHVHE